MKGYVAILRSEVEHSMHLLLEDELGIVLERSLAFLASKGYFRLKFP